MSVPKVDVLAQEIRSVDGRHSICAADLAEALMPFIEREFVARDAVADLEEVARMVIRSNDMHRWGDSCQPIVNAAHAALARIGGAE